MTHINEELDHLLGICNCLPPHDWLHGPTEQKQAIVDLINKVAVEAEKDVLKRCYVDRGEIYVKFQGGFAEQYEYLRVMNARAAQLSNQNKGETNGQKDL